MKKALIPITTIVLLGLAAPLFAAAQIKNPLAFNSISDFLAALLELVVLIATPIVVVMIIYSGFLFVTAGGNETKLSLAKRTFFWTIIGALIVLGAQALSLGIQGTVDELKAAVQIFLA